MPIHPLAQFLINCGFLVSPLIYLEILMWLLKSPYSGETIEWLSKHTDIVFEIVNVYTGMVGVFVMYMLVMSVLLYSLFTAMFLPYYIFCGFFKIFRNPEARQQFFSHF